MAYSKADLDAWLTEHGIAPSETVAVAVSGGADSLALALMTAEVRPVVAMTVDHGLRSGSGEEAHKVSSVMAAHSIRHTILSWAGEKPSSNIQAEARAARYDLLAKECRRRGITYLLTAHHREDQAETLLLRLGRGSGLYGLAAMAEIQPDFQGTGVTLVRPLLGVSKSELRDFLESRSVAWSEDPSNENLDFDRIKIRKFLEDAPLAGMSVQRIAETAGRLRRSREAVEFYVAQWLDSFAELDALHSVMLPRKALFEAPDEIILRGLVGIIQAVTGAGYGPRFESLTRVCDALKADDFKGATLAGCKMEPCGDGQLLFAREPSAIRAFVPDAVIWDHRYRILGNMDGMELVPLSDPLWGQARNKWPGLRGVTLPKTVRQGLPAVTRRGEDGRLTLVAVPVLGYSDAEAGSVILSPIQTGLVKK